MADDQNPYNFGWFKQPAAKSLAKIKRKTEGWQTTSPSQVEGIGQEFASDKRQVFSEDAQGQDEDGMIANPNITPTPIPGENPNVVAPPPPPAMGVPDGPTMNPHTGGEASSLQNWMNAGGSLHTFHNKQVTQGLRPAIDARATVSPQEGMAYNTDIRQGWGWEPENFGHQGSELMAAGGSGGDAQRLADMRTQSATQLAQKSALAAQQQQRLRLAQAQVNTPAVNSTSNAQ